METRFFEFTILDLRLNNCRHRVLCLLNFGIAKSLRFRMVVLFGGLSWFIGFGFLFSLVIGLLVALWFAKILISVVLF